MTIKNSKLKPILIGIGITIGAIISAKALLGILALSSIFISFLIGCVVTIILISRSRSEKPEDIAKEVVEQVVTPEYILRPQAAKERLIKFEEEFALGSPQDDVRSKVSTLTDNLLEVVQPINERFFDSEITYEVTQMAIEHFPNRVLSYLKLDDSEREKRKANLFADIDKMQDIVDKVSDVLKNADVNDDKRQDLLSDIKYENNL
jgi:hypothetical protein